MAKAFGGLMDFRRSRRFFFGALLAASALILPVAIAAHPTGVSKVDLTIRPDTIEARVDVNRDDLYYALRFKALSDAKPPEWPGMVDRIVYYFQTRLDLRLDGNVAQGMRVIESGIKHPNDRNHKMDSVDLDGTAIVLKLQWPIPAGARKLEMGAKLFAELEVQPLSHVRVMYRGLEIKRRFLGLDDRMILPLQTDSLEAAYNIALAASKSGAGGDSGKPATSTSMASTASGTSGAVGATSEEESVVKRFVWLGFRHILPEGTDHILFVLGLFFFSIYLRPLFLQVTAFTVAHSLTLGLSLLNDVTLPARLVQSLIALSIVVVAVENIFFRKMRPSRWALVFAFGLIHGLGFAGVLKGLGLPQGQFLKVLISFNVGVELGQLAVIAAAAALTAWMWNKPWYFRRVSLPISIAISAVGLYWFIQRAFGLG